MDQLYNNKLGILNDFDSRTPIIYQNPYVKGVKISNDKKLWLLLPMIAYKVLVPYPKDKELNIFQETILKLFLSGNKSDEYIAEKLLLDKKLVNFIKEQLIESNLLTKEGLVTNKGKKLLDDTEGDYDLKIGYVFYDLVNKNYNDTFVFDTELGFVNSRFGENTRKFDYGSVGKPREAKAYVVKTSVVDYNTVPNNVDILNVCIRHNRRMTSLSRGGYYSSNDQERLPKNLEKVKFLGDILPVYVATYIYLPDDLQNRSYWQICHPFFGGTSIRLRENIEIISHNTENKHIKDELNRLIQDSLRVDIKEINLANKKNDKESSEFIINILSNNILEYPEIFNKLIRVKNILNQIQISNKNKGKNHEDIQKKLGDCLIYMHESIEETLYRLKCNYSDYFNDKVITNDMSKNSEILSLIAKEQGFEDNSNIFRIIFNLKKGNIKFAATGENKELKSILAVNLLIAKEFNDHPFKILGQRVPAAIRFLYDLLNRRNINKHTVYENDDIIQVENTFLRVLYILSILFENLHFNYNENVTFYREGFNSTDIESKLRIASEAIVEGELGLIIRDYDVINKTLIEAHIAMKSYNQDFIVHCSKCLENLFLLIDRSVININAKNIIPTSINEHLNYLQQELKNSDYSFNFNINDLDSSFTNVDPRKIKNTFTKLDQGVLSTRIYVMLYSGIVSYNKIIDEISKETPDILLLSDLINKNRGHGDTWTFNLDEAENIFFKLINNIKIILPILKNNKISQ